MPSVQANGNLDLLSENGMERTFGRNRHLGFESFQ